MYSERPLPPPPLPSSPPTRFTLPPIGSPPMFKRTLPPLSFPNHTPPPPPAPPPPSQQHQPTTAPMNPIHHHNNSSSATIATTTSTTTGNSHASSALPFRHSNNPTTPIRELDAFSLPRPPTMSAASTYASHHHPPPPPPAASTASAASAAASSPLFRSVNGNASSPTPAQVPVPSAATRSIQPQQPERHPCKPASSSSLFTVPNRKSGNTSVSTPLPTLVADDRHMPKKEMYYRYDLDEPSPLIWQADADRKEEQYALVNDGLRSIESEFDEHCDAIYQEKLKKLQDELSEIQHADDNDKQKESTTSSLKTPYPTSSVNARRIFTRHRSSTNTRCSRPRHGTMTRCKQRTKNGQRPRPCSKRRYWPRLKKSANSCGRIRTQT
ncbi:hypothetical protein BCR43DRAFT_2682 [Syncephalastrum racemosum]|uniref:Uncharacterized protein n=1 Tax=Syncephalastrum racemosum TaxID=13706 RepID=A0A1X2HRP3_SYNRA|nr:hypothetical protein BCR43DRAFT_2682 [Syncephalastrum racemosum]